MNGDHNSPSAILSNFASDNEDIVWGYSNEEFDEIYNSAIHSEKLSDSVQLYSEAESAILDDFSFIPVFYESEYLICTDETEGIIYNPFTKELNFIRAKNYD